jgi:alpha-glucan,water dikinase
MQMRDSSTITTESGIAIKVEKRVLDNQAEVALCVEEQKDCLVHWGLRRNLHAPWQAPPGEAWPQGSRAFDQSAVQTPFTRRDGHGEIVIKLDLSAGFSLLEFVLFFPAEGRWDNNRGRNYRIEIPQTHEVSSTTYFDDPELDRLAGEIIEKEMSRNSWTLMHRFDLCYDLLDEIRSNNPDGMALIFIWLRFSHLRQLDWQRNYNTKPGELGHAMDRLTLKLADRYEREQGEGEIIRLIMTTLGRGGNAQRVRDEVLNIMHRHRMKEVSGHFMEEWHQKLHNNTTPDDVVICQAYLEFLKSDGNLGRFYKRLREGGVTRERLESYERPIRSHPDFIPGLKDALIRDFENFLGILKEVHSGTDLGVAIQASRRLFDEKMHGLMDFIWSHRNDEGDIISLSEKITESRRYLANQFEGAPSQVRDLLLLDIALEDSLRATVEKNLSARSGRDQLTDLLALILENLCLSNKDEEFRYCLDHWKGLRGVSGPERERALHAEAVLDRIRRALGSFVDHYYRLLQPKAEVLGRAFHADSWTVTLFSEEVLRGRPAFALSMVLRYLDPILRRDADLGNWQVIGRGRGTGEVKVVEALKSVQGKSFERPVVLIADRIGGDEEIPQGITAIITPSVIDSLSHLAIRARNAGVLFAVCYDEETIAKLKSLKGSLLRLSVKNTNDVFFEESREEAGIVKLRAPGVRAPVSVAGFTVYALPMDDFSERNVGYKSNKLKNIHGKLPEWIGFPASVALPFGVFEKVLAGEQNRKTAGTYTGLVQRIENAPEKGELLAELRKTVLDLAAPEELITSLRRVMEGAGLTWPSDWNGAWMCIKHVWSSKWNDRAFLSREANGIPHDALFMSVLIQRVIEADYSFVIHTVNPLTAAKDEVYAEVVLGLGEALAANYPGRALSFTCSKGAREELRLLSFPSKSTGLYGGGLIFRSDSNGEDLAGYAGAGLYDSFVLPPPRKVSLDYTHDSLAWDEGFRKDLLVRIAGVGTAIESVMKSPQDIEGAYSKGQYFVVQTRPQVGIEDV